MSSDHVNDEPADTAIDAANAGGGSSRITQDEGLPPAAPDLVEDELGDQIDNIVPTRGYGLTPTVGLGGSAGGIQALTAFFDAMPPDSGQVFVVVLHLSPEHESTLAELLARHPAMPVVQAEDGMAVEPNHVYVIPPRKYLSSVDGHLRLTHLEPERGKRMTVDVFFRTLADTHGAHATAIVLSGADGDGAIGLRRIKERGGLTVAQDPDEAEYASMPHTAIDTGMVDWVLRAAEIPARLAEYTRRAKRLHLPPEEGPQPAQAPAPHQDESETALRSILAYLHTRTGHNFSYYKRATILRRVSRRLQINGIETLPEYLSFLRTHHGEAGALLQDLLISVTNFFRDRAAFATLETHIPNLFRHKGAADHVRVWVAACATGEEAYSVAMLLFEHARTLPAPPHLQVFATDLSEEVIREAREGIYPATISADVSAERLARFFVKEHRGYRVRRELREIVLFAQHDLLKDSPFSKLDLVTCRNLLIYLNRDAQKRAVDIFHFALRPGGHLFLGTSESVDEASDLFTPLEKKHRLYVSRPVQRIGLPVPVGPNTLALATQGRERVVERPVLPTAPPPAAPAAAAWPPTEPPTASLPSSDVQLRMLAQFGPPVIIVNAQEEIVHLSGSASRYLQFHSGVLTRHLLQAVHPMLRIELRAAMYRATQSQQPAHTAAVPVELDGERLDLDIEVLPAQELAAGYLIVNLLPRPSPLDADEPSTAQADPVAQQLERELDALKTHLHDLNEQHEVAMEEHKAGSEELQAMNEELRSASEELETGREELQSINEELTTVNSELKNRVDQLGGTNSDLQNLMAATQIATVFLDRKLCITRYTPNAIDLFKLIPTDLGRPLDDIKHRLDYPGLEGDAEQVLASLSPIERVVSKHDDGWFLARLQPYRTVDDHIAGVVLTFVDITERRTADALRRRTEERLRLIVNSALDYAIFALDLERRVTSWSPGAQAMLGYAEADILGQPGDLVFTPEDRAANVPVLETEKAAREGRAQNERYHLRQDGSRFYGSGLSMPLREDDGTLIGFVKIMRDLTEAKNAEDALRASEEQFRSFVEATSDAVYKMSPDWSEMRYLEGKQFLADTQNPSRTWLEAYIPPEDQPPVLAAIQEAVRDKRPFELEHRIIRSDGAVGWTFSRAIPLLDARGEITEWIGAASDVTERKRTEEAIRAAFLEVEQARGEAVAANRAKDHFLAVLSHELRTPLMPITMALAGLAHRQDVPEAVRKAHEMIGRNVELEARFIDDMLDVTRIARGKMEIMRADMDLHEAVRRAVEVATSDIEAKDQRLTVTLQAGECRLSGDFARLQQVIWNLLKNASKFTPTGGAIEIRSWCPDDAHHMVEVIDTGIGLEAEAIERIFNAFEQASASITREFGGLGLGLAIAKATVEAHGGTLRASSPGPGQGATFTVSLPLAAAPAAAVGTAD